jgi:type 1 glutamine amidotransferase
MTRCALFRLIVVLLWVGIVQGCLANPQPADKSIRLLLLTGEDYPGHKWQQTAPVLESLYAQDPRFAVDVVEDLSQLSSANLEAYDAVVMHFKNYDPNVPGRKGFNNLARFVQQGGGLVLVHFACGAFQEFKDDFTKLAGRAWNPALRGHDPFGEFTVNITDKTHPIMAGMQDFALTDELYTCLDGDVPIQVLASATSKVDKKVYPMAFVMTYGKGRVFHSVLGHDVNALSNRGTAELYRRGTAWTVGMEPIR